MTIDRRHAAHQVRVQAAETARMRVHPDHIANPDERRYAGDAYPMSFTKGLGHDPATGLVAEPDHFEAFRRAVDDGVIDAFTDAVPVPNFPTKGRRTWEAPTAGLVYDLQGPDAQAVTMPPAPPLGSLELAYEMAEVYELALLRDTPLTAFEGAGAPGEPVTESVDRLNAIGYSLGGFDGRPRTNVGGALSPQTVFRGSAPMVADGPYLSQFLLIGNAAINGDAGVADGYVNYGAQRIDQRVPTSAQTDYLVTRQDWLEAQDGCDLRDNAALFDGTTRRFITTPRDLAAYVHDDALYQAYLNAALIMLGMGAPFDPGFAHLAAGPRPGRGRPRQLYAQWAGGIDIGRNLQAGGFALFGGPHILSLVTEVATRGLKAVRYQKFNTHMRLRPEALAGRIEFADEIAAAHPGAGARLQALRAVIQPTVDAVRARNQAAAGANTALLPMAFQEGSPMHPSYGAGHATVAGACVTILKAFFDTGAAFVKRPAGGGFDYLFDTPRPGDAPVAFTANADGSALVETTPASFLTLEGELNKLAANISIGRNMAGVHYYSDYLDSLRMGEEIAVGILQEQAQCYPTDPFVVSLPTYRGGMKRIGGR